MSQCWSKQQVCQSEKYNSRSWDLFRFDRSGEMGKPFNIRVTHPGQEDTSHSGASSSNTSAVTRGRSRMSAIASGSLLFRCTASTISFCVSTNRERRARAIW